eukprot:SAG11_NODE_4580_length_1844_cov_1.911748_1_plen_147_part_00
MIMALTAVVACGVAIRMLYVAQAKAGAPKRSWQGVFEITMRRQNQLSMESRIPTMQQHLDDLNRQVVLLNMSLNSPQPVGDLGTASAQLAVASYPSAEDMAKLDLEKDSAQFVDADTVLMHAETLLAQDDAEERMDAQGGSPTMSP